MVTLKAYDLFVFAQKVAPCVLTFTAWHAYGNTMLTLVLTAIVFSTWLRVRYRRRQRQHHAISSAMLMFGSVFGVQVYVLLGEARWFAASATDPVSHWARDFRVAVLFYVVCVFVWCVARVVLRWYLIVRGPPVARRKRGSLYLSSAVNGLGATKARVPQASVGGYARRLSLVVANMSRQRRVAQLFAQDAKQGTHEAQSPL